ncbi:MAG: ribonuclease III [Chloroflexota bacterium]
MNSDLDPQADPAPVAELAQRLGLPFSNLHLLTRALTHRSYVNENPRALEDNERLEFLGDAVLDFVVGAWVYHHFPEMAEGELTRLRSALVKTDQLARFARILDLGPALRLGRGELTSGGRDRDNLLCGAFEAMIGAMYLEEGVAFVERFVQPLLETARADVFTQPDLADAKSRLQEWAQGEKLGAPRYVTVGASGPDHAKQFEVEVRLDGKPLGRGQGSSKAAAEQEAAKAALRTLGLE